MVGNCNFFLPLAFNVPVGVFPLELGKRLDLRKKDSMLVKCFIAYTHLPSTISEIQRYIRGNWQAIDFQQFREVNERFLTTFWPPLGMPMG